MIKIPFWISHIFPRIDLLSHQKKTGFSFNFQAMVTWLDPGIGGRDQEIESSSQTKARSKTGNQANHQASWNERDTWTWNYMFLMFQISVHFFIKKVICFFCTFCFPCTDSIKCSSFDHFFFDSSLGLDVGNSGRKRRRNSNRIHRPFPRHRRKKWHQPLRKRMYHLQWWKRTGNWSKTVYSYSVDWGGEQNPHPPKLTWQWKNKAKTTIWGGIRRWMDPWVVTVNPWKQPR